MIRGSFRKYVTERRHSVNFQTMKIPKYTFCRGFNSEYELWVLLRWRHINMATLPLKASYKEQPSVIRLLWAEGHSANAIQSEMRPTSILQDQQCMFGVRSLLMVEEVLLMRKNLVAVLFRRPMRRSQRSIPSCGQTGVWWDKCLHEFGRYVEKWNINVWRLNTFACWTCSLFSF